MGKRTEAKMLAVKRSVVRCLVLICGFTGAAVAQDGSPLTVRTTSLPKAYLHKSYEAKIEAQGGATPLKWELTDGSLPAGITLSHDGILSGTPARTGEFHFTVTVRDSGVPQYQRQQQLSLVVVAPLLAEWGRYPKVNGQRLEGSILVSNQTEQDFDLTVVVLAVNPIGRATAIGYQHFPLKKDTTGMEIPFGDNLPDDSYQLNVDAVAEVAETDSIYRTRLVPKERFVVQTEP
jgi:hypothetical protein